MENLDEIKARIQLARKVGHEVHEARVLLAGVMAGAPGIVEVEVVFPEPDIMHTYQCMFGRRVGEPVVYRLSFGKQLKWVGVSHPWGLKPADIIVEEADGHSRKEAETDEHIDNEDGDVV